MRLFALALALLPACLGGMTTGMVVPVGPSHSMLPAGTSAASYTRADAPAGVEFRLFGTTGDNDHNPLMPNAYGVTYRQIGDEHVQTAGQAGWAGALRLGSGFVFGRMMFDVLNSQRTLDGDHKYSAFSPTLDLGIAPTKKGLCFSASATYDIHFNDPDRWLFGVFAGVCGNKPDP
jgi:hypothetical protein